VSRFLAIVSAFLFLISPALAHVDEGQSAGFLVGFAHPLYGWDHVVAMVAVGLWGAVLGKPALWVLPITFPIVMSLGAVLGILGIHVPAIETGIAISAVFLGLLIAMMVKAPLPVAAVLVGAFAVFHGYAHGIELPGSANPVNYAIGFVTATGLLHLLGIAFGSLMKFSAGKIAMRAAGAGIAAVGVGFLLG
jgi:urease accessory protein